MIQLLCSEFRKSHEYIIAKFHLTQKGNWLSIITEVIWDTYLLMY